MRPSRTQGREKAGEDFRSYGSEVCDGVREFQRINHANQTLDFVLRKKGGYGGGKKRRMGIRESMESLIRLVDESDPDTELPRMEQAPQTAEAIPADGHPDWFVLTGFIHDLGKVLRHYGEPPWAVVTDTLPVGCDCSSRVVFADAFSENPDAMNPAYRTATGTYSEGRDLYAAHHEGEYQHLMDERDRQMFRWVRVFSPCDLNSKGDERPDAAAALMPHCERLVARYFPPVRGEQFQG